MHATVNLVVEHYACNTVFYFLRFFQGIPYDTCYLNKVIFKLEVIINKFSKIDFLCTQKNGFAFCILHFQNLISNSWSPTRKISDTTFYRTYYRRCFYYFCPPYYTGHFEFWKSDLKFVVSEPKNLISNFSSK